MNTAFKYIGAALLLTGLAACSNDDNLSPDYQTDPEAVHVTAAVGNDQVISKTNPVGTTEEQKKFNSGDQIAVAAGTQEALAYTLGTDGNWTPTAGTYLEWQSATMDISAYYPVTEGTTISAFTLPADQTTLEKLNAADYMTATSSDVAKTTDNVPLSFQRKTARVVVKTTLENQFVGYQVKGLDVNSNTSGYQSGTVYTGIVAMNSYKHTDGTFYVLLTPTTADADVNFLTFTMKKDGSAEGEGETTLAVKGIPAMEAGKSYTFNVKVGKSKVEITSVTVKDWNTGAVIEENGQTTEEKTLGDPALVSKLIALGVPATNGVIDPTDATTKTKLETITTLSINYSNTLVSLDGIEYLTNLQTLSCAYCKGLTYLDISKNTKLKSVTCTGCTALALLNVGKNDNLTELYCKETAITSLNVDQAVNLQKLYCENTGITTLNVDKNVNLTGLYCTGNKITTLNVSKNTKLENLWCDKTYLEALDLTNNTSLKILRCGNASNNTNLTLTIKTATYNSVNFDFKGQEEDALVTLNLVD